MLNRRPQESCRPWAWLIFDVRQRMKSSQTIFRRSWWFVPLIGAFVVLGNWTFHTGTTAERAEVEQFLRTNDLVSRYFGSVESVSKQSAPGKVTWFSAGKKEGRLAYRVSGSKKDDTVIVYWKADKDLIIEKVITDSVFSSPTVIYERAKP